MARVHDGDTALVEIGGVEIDVRLMGINAAEEGECFHEEATEHLIGLIEGRRVGVEEVGTDQFGRTLAYLWQDETLVNLGLVAAGFAIATTPDEREPYGDLLISAEDTAASNRIGLWAEDVCGGTGPLPEVRIDASASQFDPRGPDEEVLDQEWVVVQGPVKTVDLTGWTLRDESSAHRCLFPAGTLVAPETPLTVTSADSCWEPGAGPVWNNGGDMVLLLDPAGRVVTRARYDG